MSLFGSREVISNSESNLQRPMTTTGSGSAWVFTNVIQYSYYQHGPIMTAIHIPEDVPKAIDGAVANLESTGGAGVDWVHDGYPLVSLVVHRAG